MESVKLRIEPFHRACGSEVRLISKSSSGPDLYCGEIAFGSEIKNVVIECSGNIKPRLFTGSGVFAAMADNTLWIFGMGYAAIVEHELMAPFDVAATQYGILVFYELGCRLFSMDVASEIWDFKHGVLNDYQVTGETVTLTFDDGSTKSLALRTGELIS
jgi:hypothetical protein